MLRERIVVALNGAKDNLAKLFPGASDSTYKLLLASIDESTKRLDELEGRVHHMEEWREEKNEEDKKRDKEIKEVQQKLGNLKEKHEDLATRVDGHNAQHARSGEATRPQPFSCVPSSS